MRLRGGCVNRAQGQAGAEVMEAKAAAWLSYGEKSYVDMVVEQLPTIAKSLVTPLNKVDKMVMINGDGTMRGELIGHL